MLFLTENLAIIPNYRIFADKLRISLFERCTMDNELSRYFITLSYDGTRYHGWQVQPNGITVQGELQRALSLLLRHEVTVTGAGRTDTGVHARMMVAHFDLPTLPSRLAPPNPHLVYKLNRLLPCDIAVQKIEPVAPGLHARFSATSRTYLYYVHTGKQPFLRHYSLELHYALDFALMNEAAALLLEYDDFGAFCKSHADVKTTLCRVTHARWHQVAGGEDGSGLATAAPTSAWYFEITANRFLRNMVRAVVGTLVEVGRGRLSLEAFRKVVEGRQRTDAGESMPAHALFLEDITYNHPANIMNNPCPIYGNSC